MINFYLVIILGNSKEPSFIGGLLKKDFTAFNITVG